MSERASLQRQIEELDRQVRDLVERIDDRQTMSARPQVWLAKTIGQTITEEVGSKEKEYPSGVSSTFGIQFRHPKFDESVGDRELDGPFGDDEPQRFALTVPKRFIADETDVFVVEIDGRFYFLNSGREVLIVEIDADLEKATTFIKTSTIPGTPQVDCVQPTHQPATIWSFTDGVLCPTEQTIDAPEGVFNFQTDKVHKAKKAGGDPNLMLVYREAGSGKWVPECSTCEAPVPVTSLLCDCLGDAGLCRVHIHFRLVGEIGLEEEISGQVWPNYCNWTAPPGAESLEPCTSCELWNTPSGWELYPEIGNVAIDDCRMGVLGRGSTSREPFKAVGNFPCDLYADASEIIANFSCPDPTNGTGGADVDFRIKGCLLFTLSFDDIEYIADFDPDSNRTHNRVTRIHIPGVQFNRCVCLVDTTRNDLGQGNFNADTGTPDLLHGLTAAQGGPAENVPGHNYTVNVAGTHDFGDGGVVLEVNDLVVFDDLINKWVVIKSSGGAVDNTTFVPVEIVRFIDSDGCSWSNTLKFARINLVFKLCP